MCISLTKVIRMNPGKAKAMLTGEHDLDLHIVVDAREDNSAH